MTHTASNATGVAHFRTMALSFSAGPLTWIIYFLVGYLLIEAACKSTAFDFAVLGLSGISAIILGLTLIALIVVGLAGGWAFRTWQVRQTKLPDSDPEGPFENDAWLAEGHIRFMTFVGLLLNILFAAVILLTGLAVFFLQPC